MPVYASARDAMRAEGWGGEVPNPASVSTSSTPSAYSDNGDSGGGWVGIPLDPNTPPYVGVQQDFGPRPASQRAPVAMPQSLSGEPLERAFERWFDIVPLPVGGRPRGVQNVVDLIKSCLLYTSPSPRDRTRSRMPSSA